MKDRNRNYRAWQIDEKDFPKKGTIEEKIKFLTGYGLLAPSTHNTQPWLFEVSDNLLTISPNYERKLTVADPENWGIFISLGACAENIIRAAKAYGLGTSVSDDKDKIILKFSADNAVKNYALLKPIINRKSDKLPYLKKQLDSKTSKVLLDVEESNIDIAFLTDRKSLEEFTKIHLDAAREIADNPAFGRELSQWLRNNKTKSSYGMPGFVIGNSEIKSKIGKKLLNKKPQILTKLVKKDATLIKASSAIAVFSVKNVNPKQESIKKAGREIENFWLKVTQNGLVGHPIFASIQLTLGRNKLKKLIGGASTPVFVMRIGYSNNQAKHTPRALMTPKAIDNLANTLNSKPKSYKLQIDKYKINYVKAGSGKPLLLIHGANIGWPQWHQNIDELAKNHTVYAIDLPGAGDSSKVNFRKTNFEEDFAKIVDAFIKKLELNKIDVVGSSFGGWIAMRLAIMQKPYINKLILTNPIGFTRHMPMKFRPVSIWPFAVFMSKTALRPRRNNKNLEKFMRDVFHKKDIPLKSEFIDYFYELSKTSHNLLFISRLAHYSGMRRELFLGESLHKIRVPTLVIWGKKDPLMPYVSVKDNFRKIPGIHLSLLENVGHMPPVESPKEFNNKTIEFLKS